MLRERAAVNRKKEKKIVFAGPTELLAAG